MYTNQNSTQTLQAFFKINIIIHAALLIGQVLFGVVSYAISPNPVVNLKAGNDPFFYIVPVLIASGIFFGSFLFNQQISKLAEKESLKEKLTGYQTALIIRYALAEGPSLFGIVAFMLGGNLFYLLLVGLNIIYFIWIRPTKEKIKEALNLTYEDEIAIEGR